MLSPHPRRRIRSLESLVAIAERSLASGVMQLLRQDLPLASLQAGGGVSAASFNMGAVMPAGAIVFPNAAQIQVVAAFTASVAMAAATAFIASAAGFPVVVRAPTPADCTSIGYWGGGPVSDADLGALFPSQGGNQLLCHVALSGPTFSQLTAGHIVATIPFFVP